MTFVQSYYHGNALCDTSMFLMAAFLLQEKLRNDHASSHV